MVVWEREDATVLTALRAAGDDGWSGRVAVVVDEREMGSVVMRAGRIAWAVCVEQTEDLGTFLWRLGRVTREELALLRERYAEHEGRKKLGTLMEEAGILPRPVLRRCLLLHTRRALSRLVSYTGVRVATERTALSVDEDMTFALAEVLPEAPVEPSDGPSSQPNSASRWATWTEENRVLADLGAISGYLAVALLSREGEVLAAHAAREVDPATLGVFVVSMLEFSDVSTRATGLGPASAVCFECVKGTLVAQWLDPARSHVALVLVGPEGNPGMARYRLGARAPALVQWVQAHPPRLLSRTRALEVDEARSAAS